MCKRESYDVCVSGRKTLKLPKRDTHAKCRHGFTLIELLIVMAIIGILVSLLLPALSAVREAAERSDCRNNLGQLALAMQSHHEAKGTLPYAANGRLEGTWVRLLLPYIEQDGFYDTYDDSIEYNVSPNLELIQTVVPTFSCASDIASSTWVQNNGNVTGVPNYNYVVNLGNTSVWRTSPLNGVEFSPGPFYNRNDPPMANIPKYQFAHIRDGASNTLMLSEVRKGRILRDLRGLTWWGPASGFTAHNAPNSPTPDFLDGGWCPAESKTLEGWACDDATSANPVNFSARSYHNGGVNVALCDGSVQFIRDNIDIETWRNLSTIQGGETVDEF